MAWGVRRFISTQVGGGRLGHPRERVPESAGRVGCGMGRGGGRGHGRGPLGALQVALGARASSPRPADGAPRGSARQRRDLSPRCCDQLSLLHYLTPRHVAPPEVQARPHAAGLVLNNVRVSKLPSTVFCFAAATAGVWLRGPTGAGPVTAPSNQILNFRAARRGRSAASNSRTVCDMTWNQRRPPCRLHEAVAFPPQ